MSSNNICLCIILFLGWGGFFLCINSLWTSACKYTSYLSRFFVFFVPFRVDFGGFVFMSHLYIWPVLFPGGELRTWHGLYDVYLIFSFFLLSVILSRLFTVFNVIIDHVYKGSFVISVCIGKRKILLLRPTQWKYLSVYWLHHIVR